MNLRGCSDNTIPYQLGYNRTYVVVFTSCTDPNAPNWQTNPTYVANSAIGYYAEYEKTFQSQVLPANRAQQRNVDGNGAALPYSTVLRPVTSLSVLRDSESVWFDGAEFTALDTMQTANTYQNSTNNTAIRNSITSSNFGAVNSSRFFGGNVALSGINFFRPGIFYNGISVLDMSETEIKVNGANHQGDLSVGADLPFCVTGGYELLTQLDTLNVYAGAAQNIVQITGSGDTSYPFVAFPIKCTLYFRVKGQS